jgi:hypothetical protein
MIAIVREPPDFFPNKHNTFNRSCIGIVRVARDCLNKHPSCSSAMFGRHAIRLSWTMSHPIAVDSLNILRAALMFLAFKFKLATNSAADFRLLLLIF